MSLAVVVGAKSVSSRPLQTLDAEVLESSTDHDGRDNGTTPQLLVPVQVEDPSSRTSDEHDDDEDVTTTTNVVHYTVALSNDQQLQAIVTVTHYDLVWDATQVQDCTVAAVRVQILPAYESLSRHHRDCLHRIKLPVLPKPPSRGRRPQEATQRRSKLAAVFSSDQRFLSVLVPYPFSSDSVVVLFQLRRPRSELSLQLNRPPLPSYIHQPLSTTFDTPLPMVLATNPRVIQPVHESSHSPSVVTDLTDVAVSSSFSGPSILLAGCDDGSILAISYRPLVVAGCFFHPDDDHDNDTLVEGVDSHHPKSIFQLRHMSDSNDGSSSEETTGRLAILRCDGSAIICKTLMVPLRNDNVVTHFLPNGDIGEESETSRSSFRMATAASSSSLYLSIKRMETISGCFSAATWISTSYLALASCHSDATNPTTTVQVWGLCGNGPSEVLSSWDMTLRRLLENGHSTYTVEGEDRLEGDLSFVWRDVSLQYDAFSDCLAISAVLRKPNGSQGVTRDGDCWECQPLSCVWNWRRNLEGLVLTQAHCSHSVDSLPSTLHFATSSNGARRLVHIHITLDSRGPRVSKELYEVSVLSFRSNPACRPTSHLHQPNNLLLSSRTIAVPVVTTCSVLGEFEVEWQETNLPYDYLVSQGSPRLAILGPRQGRSVAIASNHGLCVLEVGRSSQSLNRGSLSDKKWRWFRFGSETEESLFQVVAMAWWEGAGKHDDNDLQRDDLIVAIIQVNDSGAQVYYLACWAPSMLDFDHQVLIPEDDTGINAGNLSGDVVPRYGVRLPSDFTPVHIDVLEPPDNYKTQSSPSTRRAVVLISDESSNTTFAVYQLQASQWRPRKAASYRDLLPFIVQSRLASSSSVGSASTLFLASASFLFDLEESKHPNGASDYVATLGVVRNPGGGIDAMAIAAAGVQSVGEVVGPDSLRTRSELASYWLADFIVNKPVEHGVVADCFAWCLEMADGSLYCWSAPSPRDPIHAEEMKRPLTDTYGITVTNSSSVQRSCEILGSTTPLEKSSIWMQQPDMGPRKVVSLACVPRSCFGCVLGAEQTCRKMHRALGEAFEKHLFRSDFLEHEILTVGDFILSIPTFIPTLYSLLVDSRTTSKATGTMTTCIQEHLIRHGPGSPFAESTLTSLQVLVLRTVEFIATAVHKADILFHLAKPITAVFTPLQFATIFIDVGRQVEPSVLPHLFPIDLGGNRPLTAESFFHLALDSGSLSVAIASLPLFDDHTKLQSLCSSILSLCLDSIVDQITNQESIGLSGSHFDHFMDAKNNVRDVFLYALKLDDSSSEQDDESVQSESSESSDSVGAPRGYSLTCGMSRFLRKKSLDEQEKQARGAATAFISDGFHDDAYETGINGDAHTNFYSGDNGALITIRVIARDLVGGLSLAPGRMFWKRGATIASILLADGVAGLSPCSSARFVEGLHALSFDDTLTKILVHGARECEESLSRVESSILLDLSLILLGRLDPRVGTQSEASGLMVLALVTGHHCDRLRELFSDVSDNDPIVTAYSKAMAQRPSPVNGV